MKKIVCDLCRKEITAADIHYNVPVTVDEDKIENLDLHGLCFVYFKQMARELMESENYTVNMENLE